MQVFIRIRTYMNIHAYVRIHTYVVIILSNRPRMEVTYNATSMM